MNKKEIIEILKEIPIKKKQFIVVGDSCLVCHGLKRKCDIVEIESLEEFSYPNVFVKKVDSLEEYEEIDDFFILSLKKLVERKKLENNINEKGIIKKIELYLDSLDNYQYERELRKKGYCYIGGVDEVGRGPLVGPVVAACCILPEEFH